MTSNDKQELRAFLKGWKDWVDNGAQLPKAGESLVFSRSYGLCWTAVLYDNDKAAKAPRPGFKSNASSLMGEMLVRDFRQSMSDSETPFNDSQRDYILECMRDGAHANVQRVLWVNKMLKELA